MAFHCTSKKKQKKPAYVEWGGHCQTDHRGNIELMSSTHLFTLMVFCFLLIAVDLSIGGMWRGRIEDQCEKMEEHPTPLSKQQLVQLIRSLILVEQVLAVIIHFD